MLKFTSLVFFISVGLQGEFVSSVPLSPNSLQISEVNLNSKISPIWVQHALDFLELIDYDKVLVTVIPYLNDPEVLNFIAFVMSEDFKNIIWEFESITEFKEATAFLTEKGYDIDSIINLINIALELPPYEKTELLALLFKKGNLNFEGKGMTGLIEAVIAVLPLEDMKTLLESKLKTNPEFAELFESINSPEFLEILRKMSQNPKFIEIKETFADYGFDFKYLCTLAKGILGEYYQGVFCQD